MREYICMFFIYYVMFYSAQLDLVSDKHWDFDLEYFFLIFILSPKIQLANRQGKFIFKGEKE